MHDIGGLLSVKFSNNVRTEQEVGYIATASLVNVSEFNNPEMFLLFIVQSTRNDLESIIKDYIDNQMLKDIESITDDSFTVMLQSVITNISQKPYNIHMDIKEKFIMLNYRTSQIDEKNANDESIFNRKNIILNALKKIKNKSGFIKFVKSILNNNITSVIKIETIN